MAAASFLLKLTFFMLASTILLFMMFAMPLGLEIFFFEKISQNYTFESVSSIRLLDFHVEVNMGLVFITFSAIYILCFITSFRKEPAFRIGVNWLFNKEKGIICLVRSPLFALPLLSSLAYIASKIINLIQEFYNIHLGEAPVSRDPMVAFLELSISPLIEELVFRILPIGAFLATYLLSAAKLRETYSSRWGALKILPLVFLDPDGGKGKAGLRTAREYGFLSGIDSREWLMIILTSVIFGFSHYTPSATWEAGKISLSFVQGLIMGLSYLVYGFQAPIIIHWFFNYYLYTYSLVKLVNPNFSLLTALNEYLIIVLGIIGLSMTFLFGIKNFIRIGVLNTKTLIGQISKFKGNLEIKYNRAFRKIRHINPKSFKSLNFALLLLALTVLFIRFLIINFPSPENGEKYYETGFVFDEVYYVKAARSLLRGESANNEHPPLVKIFIMVGIILFGDNPVGWRLFPIISSSASIILLYVLTLKLTKNPLASFLATMLLTFDVMAFNIGQISILDAPSLMFILAASILLIRERYDLSGLFFGLALLCKLSSIFSLGIILLLILKIFSKGEGYANKRGLITRWVLLSARIILLSFTIFLLGLWIYDSAYRAFGGSPLNHIAYMLNYHSILKYENPEEVILPLSWINPLNPFSPEDPNARYYVTTVREVLEDGSIHEHHPIAYYGIYSPLWWSIWVVVPLSLKEIVMVKDKRISSSFVLVWIAMNFLPYIVFAYILQRWVYPFYFYLTLPGLYIGLSHHLTALKSLKIPSILLISAQMVWFVIWFPVKPKILIDLLSSFKLPA